MIEKTLALHEKAALMFSGGKDSLACLYLLKPYWDKIIVIWINTGNIFPENEAIVREHAAMVPHFVEIKTDVEEFKEKMGLPVDLVPTQYTDTGFFITGDKSIKLVSGYECCSHNIWMPGLQAASDAGATLIIRGQRNQEHAKSRVRSGDKMGAVEFLFPIEDWTQEMVLSYLKEQGFNSPEWFNFTESSLDCINCTAFLSGIADRREYMAKNHPIEHEKNKNSLKKIFETIEIEFEAMRMDAA